MIKILKIFGFLLLFVLLIIAYVLISSSGLIGKLPQDFEVIESPRPQIKNSINTNQIFFGDLHVHTTFSQDAFLFSLPVVQGEEGGAEERDGPAKYKGCDDSRSTHDDWVVDCSDDVEKPAE